MSIRNSILSHVYQAFGLMVLLAAVVFGALLKVQYVDGEHWKSIADSLRISERTIQATRGNIYSNDGSLLATSVPEYTIRFDAMAIPMEYEDVFNVRVDSLSRKLSELFKDQPARKYLASLKQARAKRQRYLLIKRNVSHQDLKTLRTFPLMRVFKEKHKRFSSCMVSEQQNKRILPFTNLAARTIGYSSDDYKVGLEGAYGKYIDGKSGSQLMQKIAGGVWIPIKSGVEIAPVDGSDIISTMDVNMQDMAQRALEKQLKSSNADEGCVILMEVQTGEVRAIANFTRDKEGVYREKFNYAIAQGADPGSTFKVASYLAALDDGLIDTSTIVDVGNGTFKVPSHTIRDSHAPKKSRMTAKEGFEVSSNVAVTKLINMSYGKEPGKFIDKLHGWGLGEPLGLQIPGEGKPWVKSPSSKSWSKLSLLQMAYGYELKITPLQMLVVYNGIANNGRLISPLFVKEIRHLNNTVEKFDARVINKQMASPSAIGKMQAMLEGVMTNGTGKRLESPYFNSAGKTGTAQMADGSRGYGARKYQSSFAGYFPVENPKYSMIVVIRNPRNGYYGGLVAGPVFKELAEMVYANDVSMQKPFDSRNIHLIGNKVPKTLNGSKEDSQKVYQVLNINVTDWDKVAYEMKDSTSRHQQRFYEVAVKDGVVPNVIGMGLSDAVFAIENAGFRTKAKGKGRVISQSLAAGYKGKKGTGIALALN